jgi:hypothetical protein
VRLARPACFDSDAQFIEWRNCARSTGIGNAFFCTDCLPEYQARMLHAGRCAFPTVTFGEGELGLDGRRQPASAEITAEAQGAALRDQCRALVRYWREAGLRAFGDWNDGRGGAYVVIETRGARAAAVESLVALEAFWCGFRVQLAPPARVSGAHTVFRFAGNHGGVVVVVVDLDALERERKRAVAGVAA